MLKTIKLVDPDVAYQQLKDDDNILWHYTAYDAFLNILKTNELWATDYRFMNDSSEFIHSLETCLPLYERIPGMQALIRAWIANPKEHPPAEVLSFCREFDSLEQWRGYSHQSVGVALGFNARILTALGLVEKFFSVECKYLLEDKIREVNRTSDELLESYKTANIDPTREVSLGALFTFLREIVLGFKHESFKQEKEIRLVSSFGIFSERQDAIEIDSNSRRAFRLRGNAIVPYSKLPLSMPTERPELMMHPLKAILFGPSMQADVLHQRARLGEFINWIYSLGTEHSKHYRNLVIAFSKIPFRSY